MATLVSDELRWIANQIVNHLDYPSAVLSGLAPDKDHLDGGGFHCSIADLKAHGNGDDFSNTRADDRGFNPQYGAAFDISMTAADMIKAFRRVNTVWSDKTDPRRRYVNAINGWDGSGDAIRLDFDAGSAKYASPDHKWHNHGEVHRRWARDAKAARAVVSIYQGESKAAWIAREETASEEFVVATKAEVKAALLEAFDEARPYATSGPGSRLSKAGWSPLSVRGLLEYLLEDAVSNREASAEALNAFQAETRAALAAIAADPDNTVTLDAAQIETIAGQLGGRIAKAVNDDAAKRMTA